MARFHELVGAIKEPGDDGVDPTIYDDLTAEYENTFQGYTSSVQERDARIAALQSEIGALKSQNFDLLMKVDTESSNSEDRTNEVESEPSIETLFVKKGNR